MPPPLSLFKPVSIAQLSLHHPLTGALPLFPISSTMQHHPAFPANSTIYPMLLQTPKQQKKQSNRSSFLQTVSPQTRSARTEGKQTAEPCSPLWRAQLSCTAEQSRAAAPCAGTAVPGPAPADLGHQGMCSAPYSLWNSHTAPLRGRHKLLHWAPVPKEKFSSVTATQFSWKISPDSQNSQVQLRSIFM